MSSKEQIISATKDNLHVIFGSTSHEERMQHLARLWHPDALFIDAHGWSNTHQQASASVAKLQTEGWVFSELGMRRPTPLTRDADVSQVQLKSLCRQSQRSQ
jgi:hypothetical protein